MTTENTENEKPVWLLLVDRIGYAAVLTILAGHRFGEQPVKKFSNQSSTFKQLGDFQRSIYMCF